MLLPLDPCNTSSKYSIYSMALLNISTLGNLCPGLLHVRRFNNSNASFTCATMKLIINKITARRGDKGLFNLQKNEKKN